MLKLVPWNTRRTCAIALATAVSLVGAAASADVVYSGIQNVTLKGPGLGNYVQTTIKIAGATGLWDETVFEIDTPSGSVVARVSIGLVEYQEDLSNSILDLAPGTLVDGNIGGGIAWDTEGEFSEFFVGSSGHFIDKTGFAALRMTNLADVHYGWIRVRVENYDDPDDIVLTAVDWAYEDVPGRPIYVGQTGSVVLHPTSVLGSSQWTTSGDGAVAHLIDGSGLSGSGSVEGQTHDDDENAATMWHAGPVDAGLGGTTGDPPLVDGQRLVFDLGFERRVAGVYLWNHNQSGLESRGVETLRIRSSTDTDPLTASFGNTRTVFPGVAAGGGAEAAQYFGYFAPNARLIELEILDAHSGNASDYVGLAEVRFARPALLGIPSVPLAGPLGAAVLSLALGAIGAWWAGRRQV